MGASSPLAPWTVITRIRSPSASSWRLTSTSAVAAPFEEAGERGHRLALVGQRLGEEGVEAVLGLGPEPREQPPAAVVAHEEPLDQLVGAQEVGDVAQVAQDRPRLAGAASGASQRLPERLPRAGARLGEAEQPVLGPAEQRALQRAGEREVVLGRAPAPAAPPRRRAPRARRRARIRSAPATASPRAFSSRISAVNRGSAPLHEDQHVAGA